MERRWLIPAAILSALVIGLGFWGYKQYLDKKQLEVYLNSENQRAFYEMLGHVENVETLLAKGLVTSTPRQNAVIFSDIWRQAYSAQEDLNQLPIAHNVLSRTSKFLTQVGDFAYTITKKNAEGKPLKDKDWDKLQRLHTQAGSLSEELHRVDRAALKGGGVNWLEIKNQLKPGLRKKNKTVFMENFQRLDKLMQEYPTLIYDGPFSDHVEKKKPLGVTGGLIRVNDAENIARRFLSTRDNSKFRVTGSQVVTGGIPAYSIQLSSSKGDEGRQRAIVDISRKGGHVIWMLKTRNVKKPTINLREATSIAEEFLDYRGLPDMVPTYTLKQSNTAIVSFAGKEKDVIIYPDLVKVKVALDNGDVIGYEAQGYLSAHHKRNLPEPKISLGEARKILSPRFKVNSERLAVIPLETMDEALCWEFNGNLGKNNFIIYVNALTGEEEKILQVIDTGQGKLTM